LSILASEALFNPNNKKCIFLLGDYSLYTYNGQYELFKGDTRIRAVPVDASIRLNIKINPVGTSVKHLPQRQKITPLIQPPEKAKTRARVFLCRLNKKIKSWELEGISPVDIDHRIRESYRHNKKSVLVVCHRCGRRFPGVRAKNCPACKTAIFRERKKIKS
jgi:ribosomal protein L37E